MKRIILSDEQIRKASEILSKFGEYGNFSRNQKSAYAFTKIVGVKVCPYCNINYISTIFSKNKEILRPDIDHYFCKSKYKDFQLCLYNLIPSCFACNERLKGDKDFMIEPHVHPYFHDFDSIMRFSVRLKKSADYLDDDNLEISFVAKGSESLVYRAKNNIETFKLKERYQIHTDQVVELFKKAKYYWKAKQEEINRLLSGSGAVSGNALSFNSLERVLFPEKSCDINKTSLGKMKKDIINRYCL